MLLFLHCPISVQHYLRILSVGMKQHKTHINKQTKHTAYTAQFNFTFSWIISKTIEPSWVENPFNHILLQLNQSKAEANKCPELLTLHYWLYLFSNRKILWCIIFTSKLYFGLSKHYKFTMKHKDKLWPIWNCCTTYETKWNTRKLLNNIYSKYNLLINCW